MIWRIALRAAITLAALALALRIGRTLADTPAPVRFLPLWGLAGLALQGAVLWLLSLRLRLMLRLLDGAAPGLWPLLRLNWAGLALSQVALGVVGGDAARVWMLAAEGAPWPQALRRILLDRAIGLAALVLLGAAALLPVLEPAPALRLAAAVLAGTALTLAASAWLARRPGPVGAIAAELWSLVRRPGGWACLALAVLSHLLSVLGFYAAARMIGFEPPLLATLIAVPAGLLASALPASLGGWGLREAAIAATYAALGASFPGAVAASVAYGLTLATASAPGLALLPAGLRGRAAP